MYILRVVLLYFVGVSLIQPESSNAANYSGSARLYYGASLVGDGMLSFDTNGNQLYLSLSGELPYNGQFYFFSATGDTTYTTSGLSISSRPFTSNEGDLIPMATIAPKTAGSLTYRGTISVEGYSLVIEVDFSDDPDNVVS